jgi:hypothetical protein
MVAVDLFLKATDTLPAVYTSLTDATGAPIDLTSALSVTFSMALEGSSELTVDASTASFVGARTTGVVQYAWTDGDTDVPGSYLAAFTVAWPSGAQTFPSEGAIHILVQPNLTDAQPTIAPFATTDAVKAITGQDVSDGDLAIAWSVCEVMCGRPLYELTVVESDVLTARDAYWLKVAIAWQSVWVAANPDFFATYDMSTMSQSGQGGTPNPDGLVFSPLARRALLRLTWTKTRSVKMQRPVPFYRFAEPSRHDDLGTGTWKGL